MNIKVRQKKSVLAVIAQLKACTQKPERKPDPILTNENLDEASHQVVNTKPELIERLRHV